MIIGVGIDIEDVERIEQVIARWGDRFTTRIFSEHERTYCEKRPRPAQHYAARFAAKEAFGKAIGTGWAQSFRWRDVEVRHSESGQPFLRLHGDLDARYGSLNVRLSLSHTRTHVTAIIILQNIS